MENFIKNLDIFGQQVQLTFRKESKFKTQMGGLSSLFFYAFLGYLIALKTVEFNNIENAYTYLRQVPNENIEAQDLFFLNFRFAVTNLNKKLGEVEAY